MSALPPAWASALVDQVCAEMGVAPPGLAWRRRRGSMSTGVARRGLAMIAVRAGDDPLDQRLTLLHELAHWLVPPTRRSRSEHHGRAFYRVAFALYDRHGVTAADALRLESARYPSALRHAVAIGVPGATAALAARRRQLAERPRRTWRVVVPEHPVRLERDGRWHVCSTCRRRIVGRTLSRVRGGRRLLRHVVYEAHPRAEPG